MDTGTLPTRMGNRLPNFGSGSDKFNVLTKYNLFDASYIRPKTLS